MQHALMMIDALNPEIEIRVGNLSRVAMTFSANGEYLWTGGEEGVGVWRVEDGKQMATVKSGRVQCFAVSKDGRWIAAGTEFGQVFVWNAKTYETVISHLGDVTEVTGLDFSPDSSRLVSALHNQIATIWDIATRKRVQTLQHGRYDSVEAAKFSPQGDRIATATNRSVRVWDSTDGRLLVQISVRVSTWPNTGLFWFNNRLIAISDNFFTSKILREFEASTGSLVSECRVPNIHSPIVLLKHWGFIACSAAQAVAFWDTAIHTQLGLTRHPQDIRSIVLSPDDRFLAIGGEGGKITIDRLSHITVSIMSRWIVVHINNFLAPIIFP